VENNFAGLSASACVDTGKRLTVVVTGGAGFLGSHLCERLVGEGHYGICVDFHTGRRANVRGLMVSGRFDLIEHDIVEPFGHMLPRFDHIYNLACPASAPYCQADPVRTALICSQGTYNCLRAADEHGTRLLHASTFEIFSDPDVHPQTEGEGPMGPFGVCL
jgi:UDP-glucuronate decarboxylase